MRVRTVLAVLALTLAGAPSAVAAPLPVLAGTTVVTGSEVGAMRVRLPKAVRIRLNDGLLGERPSAAFRGPGRVASLVLDRGGGDVTAFHRMHVCMERGCTGPRTETGIRWLRNGTHLETTTLPAGTYTLYWVADGVPANVTLTLAGLPGRTTLRPPALRTKAFGPGVTEDTVDPVTSTGIRMWEGSSEAVLPRGGRMLMVLSAQGEHLQGRTQVCTFPAGTPTTVAEPCPSEGDRRHMTMGYTRHCPCPLGNGPFTMFWLADLGRGTWSMYADARFVGTFGNVLAVAVPIPTL